VPSPRFAAQADRNSMGSTHRPTPMANRKIEAKTTDLGRSGIRMRQDFLALDLYAC
jgi:hypothetical protein